MRFPSTTRACRGVALCWLWFGARGLRRVGGRRVYCPRCGLPGFVCLDPATGIFSLSCGCDGRLFLGVVEMFRAN